MLSGKSWSKVLQVVIIAKCGKVTLKIMFHWRKRIGTRCAHLARVFIGFKNSSLRLQTYKEALRWNRWWSTRMYLQQQMQYIVTFCDWFKKSFQHIRYFSIILLLMSIWNIMWTDPVRCSRWLVKTSAILRTVHTVHRWRCLRALWRTPSIEKIFPKIDRKPNKYRTRATRRQTVACDRRAQLTRSLTLIMSDLPLTYPL